VDLSVYSERIRVDNKITFIGRIHEQKGIVYLLEAFDKIKNEIPEYRLEIIGKINDYALDLQDKFRDKRIVWTGFINDRKEIKLNI
jgi:glycosyltransferase involved in cell wall biosynthesis